MRAFVLDNYTLAPRIKDVPIPKPGKDETLVKVAYCGVNRVDLAVFSGRFGSSIHFPLVMGSEITGTLVSGEQVAVNPYLSCGKCKFCKRGETLGCESGRPLLGIQKNGGYAEYVVVPKKNIVVIPKKLSLKEAASVTLSGTTAYRMVNSQVEIKEDDWVVVTAAAGSVGIYSCQLARLKTKKVIALAGSSEKLTKLKSLGITHAVNYQRSNWADELSKITQGEKVNIIIDTVGGSILASLFPHLAPFGQVVLCGATQKGQIELNLIDLYVKQNRIIGSSGFYNWDLEALYKLLVMRQVKPIVDSVFSLHDIPSAWEKLKSRDLFGKILISINVH